MKAETETASHLSLPVSEIRPSFWTKLVYGTGDWGMASFNTLRQVFMSSFSPMWLAWRSSSERWRPSLGRFGMQSTIR